MNEIQVANFKFLSPQTNFPKQQHKKYNAKDRQAITD